MVGLDQEVHAVDAHHAQHHETHGADGEAWVLDGVGHGQDARPDVALQQVEDRITVAGKKERRKSNFNYLQYRAKLTKESLD